MDATQAESIETDKQIQHIIDTIVREYQPEKIILFGSYAWGTPHEDSDFDIFVIKDTNVPSLKRIEALDRLFSRREAPMDFLVYTPEQVEKQIAIGDLFVKDILTNGKILYDATISR
ncbi:MAG: hypothetical protein G01um101466_414 [Parcubacteria group bacterium Gr01-1014_66]|nr:MAG: hypothetical protein G01um101466_414 [Parcubacteria group bacterium Gr01-1014_66]